MTFSDEDKLKALAIVNIFETSRPFGDYAACVVLNDGAGVSYGINQFTHRSGSLGAVVDRNLKNGGAIGRDELASKMTLLIQRSVFAVNKLAADDAFKRALRAAAATSEMRDAQRQIAFDRYLRPALEICESRGLRFALSLAVVYDSITHGSWERISAAVPQTQLRTPQSERAWITEYVRKRNFWLTNVPRLRATSYRTKFFLGQIAIGNWELRLPLNVHGVRLAESTFQQNSHKTAVEPDVTPSQNTTNELTPQTLPQTTAQIPQAQPPASSGEAEEQTCGGDAETGVFATASDDVTHAARDFDTVDGVVTTLTERRDAAKSLWTTVIGTVSQAMWAIFGFFAGLPSEVWIVVAVIAAILMLGYLYRQIELGKIRELKAKN